MRFKLFAAWFAPVALASAGALAAFACGGSSAAGTNEESPDGSNPTTACVYQVRTVYTCSGEPVAPTPWAVECVDRSDCSSVTPTTSQSEGCTATTQIQNAVQAPGTCAGIAATTTPTTTDSGAVLLDAGSVNATVCAPGDAAAFSPAWHPPRPKQSGACTSDIVSSFLQCLDDSAQTATPASCQPFSSPTGQTATCLSCLLSQSSEATWGPLIELPNENLLNVPGCLALADDTTSASSCAGALQADDECNRYACVGSCPLGSPSAETATQELAAEEECEVLASADGGPCASYVGAARCASNIALGDAGTTAEQACFGLPSGTNDATFLALAAAFCE